MVNKSINFAKDVDKIQKLLTLSRAGLSIKQIQEHLGWDDSASSRQKLLKRLDVLLEDTNSGVYREKNGIALTLENLEAEPSLETSRYTVIWKVRENLENDKKTLTRTGQQKDAEAIALVTAKKYADVFLPLEQRKVLKQRYNELHQNTVQLKQYEAWYSKVSIEPRYPGIYPNHDENYDSAERIIFDALENQTAFEARYDFDDLTQIFFPARLVQREQVLYVRCTTVPSAKLFKDYAIHRFRKVDIHPARLNTQLLGHDFIDAHTEPSVVGPWQHYDEIKLRILGPATNHFCEMRFHSDPKKKHFTHISPEQTNEQGVTSIVLTVQDIHYTYEIRSWILGFGPSIEVISPSSLRKNIKAQVMDMLKNYTA